MFRSPFEDDPFFRDSMSDMHHMMNMHQHMMSQPSLHPTRHYASSGRRHTEPNMAVTPFNMMDGLFGGSMMGGGLLGGSMFGGMESMMRNMQQSMRVAQSQQGMPGSSYHSSFTTVSYGDGDEQPKVYKSSSSARIGPNGVRETQKTEENSETGLRKMAIGHHIDERSHVIEKSRNAKTGDNEQSQEFVNIDEEDAEKFDQEFKERLHRSAPQHHRSVLYHPIGRHPPPSHHPAAIEYHHRPPNHFSSTQEGGSRRQPARHQRRRERY